MSRKRVEALLGRTPRRVLLLGPRAAAHREEWKHAEEVDLRSAPDPTLEGSGPWDVVILDGALERERWDRWMLQRVHRAMSDGAILLVRTDHLLDLGSLAGVAYFASRVTRQIRRLFARRGAIPTADRSEFRGRRYQSRGIAAMASGVAFDVVSVGPEGHGWPRPLASLLGPLAGRTASHLVVIARRLPSLWGEGRVPVGATIESGFRSAHAAALAAREEWAARIGWSGPTCDLDVAAMASAGVVVFSPHPDDEVIGCGGTLLDIAARGGAVTIVQVTDGSDSAAFITEPESVRRQVRLDEAQRVAHMLGARDLVCLRADNRNLRPTTDLLSSFRHVLTSTRPGTVFIPSFIDLHPDHQTVLRLLAEAMRGLTAPLPNVALYEVWSLVPHMVVNDVGAWMPRIEELLLAYETALKIDDYVHMVAERLLFHSLSHRGRPGYLEGFEIHPGTRFLELADTHLSSRTA